MTGCNVAARSILRPTEWPLALGPEPQRCRNVPPPALANVASAADLDLRARHGAITLERTEITEDLLEGANRRLRKLFDMAWSQSRVEVRLPTDDNVLRIFIRSDEGNLHRVAERSDGLKIFVALVAFLEAKQARAPIRMIDEAEQHLHWDAQADLMNMLHRQKQTGQMIYTTHSPGCLPHDLGTAVRLVLPAGDDRSRVMNCMWEEGPGFDPMLMALEPPPPQ